MRLINQLINISTEGRLFYGLLMDRTSYKTSMLLVSGCLTLLVSSLPLTSTLGMAAFTVWVWAIYFTFPGTYSTMPAVTTQVTHLPDVEVK